MRCPLPTALATAAALVLTSSPARSATLHVPSEYTSIQAGLAAAVAGDVVEVACGTYAEHGLVVPSGVVLRSESGDPACVTIDGELLGRVLRCDLPANGTTLKGLTIRRGLIAGGSGISVSGGALLVADCVLEDNGGDVLDGGAIHASAGASLFLERCVLRRNACTHQGGALLIVEGATAEVADCEFRDNAAGGGGAIHCIGSTVHLIRTLLAGNTCDASGGAIAVGSSVVDAIDCAFENNVAHSWGGAIVAFGSTVQATGTRFVGNAGAFGGVLAGSEAVIGLEECLLAGNDVTNEGAALYLLDSSDATVSHCTLARNTDPFDGCVTHARLSSVAFSHTIVADNDVTRATQCAAGGTVTAICTDIFGNTSGGGSGDWTSCQTGQLGLDGNLSADPLFCDPDAGDFTLRADSPCAGGNSGGCELIGALDVACGSVTAAAELLEAESWGRVKVRYREGRER